MTVQRPPQEYLKGIRMINRKSLKVSVRGSG
jgi:hypothetical protein